MVLDCANWDLVSRSFRRFFNLGEVNEPFDFDGCKYYAKEDGSLINLYYWHGGWHVNTRGSFGDAEVNESGRTWRELFISGCQHFNLLPKEYTYTFEICSPYNKVVRHYSKPQAYLLTAFDGCEELNDIDQFADTVSVVQQYNFGEHDYASNFLLDKAKNDPTFEGFVLRDKNNNRFKMKNSTYVALHHMHDNGNVANPKRLIPLIVNNEIDEILVYYPELRPEVDKWKSVINTEWQTIDNLWFCYWDAKSDKAFAQAIVGKTKFTDCLFRARKNRTNPKDYFTADTVVKALVK